VDHDVFADIFERHQADELAAANDRHGGAAGLLHALKQGVEHLGVLGHLALAVHHLTHDSVSAPFGQRLHQISTGQQADDLAALDDRKIGLRPSEQLIDRRREPVLRSEGAEPRDHRMPHRDAAHDGAHLHEVGFALRTKIDEQGNEEQEWVVEQPEKPKQDGHALAHAGGGLRCAHVVHAGGQERAEHAAAIHGEGRQQVEQDQPHVHDHELHEQRRSHHGAGRFLARSEVGRRRQAAA